MQEVFLNFHLKVKMVWV